MGNFERLSVLVIVVIIVLIVVIALVQLTEGNEATAPTNDGTQTSLVSPNDGNGGTNGGAGMNGNGVSIPPTPRPLVTPPTPQPPDNKKGPISIRDIVGGDPFAPPAPPAPPAPTPKPEEVAAKEEPKVHVVQPGETIAKIARIYFPKAVTKGTDAILKANPDVDPSRMKVGAKLTIPVLEGTPMAAVAATTTSSSGAAAVRPQSGTTSTSIAPGGTYTTKKGDTLASISRRAYGKTERWQDIWLANYDALGDDVDKPAAGIRLKIPR